MTEIVKIIARDIGAREEHVENVIALIDEGCTIPFIARYRKEQQRSPRLRIFTAPTVRSAERGQRSPVSAAFSRWLMKSCCKNPMSPSLSPLQRAI